MSAEALAEAEAPRAKEDCIGCQRLVVGERGLPLASILSAEAPAEAEAPRAKEDCFCRQRLIADEGGSHTVVSEMGDSRA